MGLNQIGGIARVGSTAWQNSPAIMVPAGSSYLVPAGNFYVIYGPYLVTEFYDSLQGIWRTSQSSPTSDPVFISSDGANYRIKNPTGTAISSVVTAAGSGMNNGVYSSSLGAAALAAAVGNSFTFAESAGGSPNRRATWNIVVGGLISTTLTIVAAGAGYQNFPIITFSDPPAGGVRATAVVTALTAGGGISTYTVTNQGAGYVTAPTITVVAQQGDTTGAGASLTSALTGSGTLAALYATENGQGYSSAPTLTMTGGGSPAATAIPCLTVTALAAPTMTGGVPTSGTFAVPLMGQIVTATPIYTNPAIQTGIFTPQAGMALMVVTSATAATYNNGVTATAPVYGGLHQTTPTPSPIVTVTAWTPGSVTMGGANDMLWLVPA